MFVPGGQGGGFNPLGFLQFLLGTGGMAGNPALGGLTLDDVTAQRSPSAPTLMREGHRNEGFGSVPMASQNRMSVPDYQQMMGRVNWNQLFGGGQAQQPQTPGQPGGAPINPIGIDPRDPLAASPMQRRNR